MGLVKLQRGLVTHFIEEELCNSFQVDVLNLRARSSDRVLEVIGHVESLIHETMAVMITRQSRFKSILKSINSAAAPAP
jgi:hypothetical protein